MIFEKRPRSSYTFLGVLKSNIECLFCREKICPFKYEPYHKIKNHEHVDIYCPKEWKKINKRIDIQLNETEKSDNKLEYEYLLHRK